MADLKYFKFFKKAVFTAFFFTCLLAQAETQQTPCGLGPLTGEEVFAKSVHDGDTLTLMSGDKVRLIGINSPEIAREERPSEAYSRQAQKALKALVMDKPLLLGFDRQERDRYGRLLAHIFTPEGVNINAKMLEAGLAAQIIVPPNLGIKDCYAKIERNARCQQQGLWQLDAFKPKKLTDVDKAAPNYLILEAKVLHYQFDKGHKLWLGPKHRIEISKKDFETYFSKLWLAQILSAESLIFRGWLSAKSGEYILRIRHPMQVSKKADFSCYSE